MTRDNQLFLGLMNGFIAFSPENMIDNQCLNRPLFTAFRLFNVPVVSGETYNGRVLFDKALSYSGEVQLKYDENYITLEFSGLNFPNPSQTSFRDVYKRQDMDRVQSASMVQFDIGSPVEVMVKKNNGTIQDVKIRPLAIRCV